jgi:hypothetical protein
MIMEVWLIMGRMIVETIISPFFLAVYLLLFTLVCWQYKRLENLSAGLIGKQAGIYLASAIRSSLLGILGGLAGSVLLIMLGINLNAIGLAYLWVIALLLILVNPRFLCFSYAAGILSLASLVFSFPLINIAHLLALVAVLHLIESLLILLNGHNYPIPLYIEKKGQVVGGFNLQKFWPLPLLALVGMPDIYPAPGFTMPDWWPLLREYSGISQEGFALLPVVAVLGYGEISTTSPPSMRVKRSSWNLFVYSLVLLILVCISCYLPALTIVAALFAPLGHELVIWLGMREESNRRPLYTPSREGVRILQVKPGSSGERGGLRERDIIIEVNGSKVDNFEQVRELLKISPRSRLQIKRCGQLITIRLVGDDPGIIPVPQGPVARYLTVDEDRIFTLVRKLWHKLPRGQTIS